MVFSFSTLVVTTSVLQIILLKFWFRLSWTQIFKVMAIILPLLTPVIFEGVLFTHLFAAFYLSPSHIETFYKFLFISLTLIVITSFFESLILRWIGKVEIRKSFLWLIAITSVYFTSSTINFYQLRQRHQGGVNVDEGKADHLKSLTLSELETLKTLPENAIAINVNREAEGTAPEGAEKGTNQNWGFLNPYEPEVRTFGQGVDFIYDRSKSVASSKYVSFSLKRSTGESVDLTAKVVENVGSNHIYEIWPFGDAKAVLFAGQFLLVVDLQKLKLCGTKIQLSPNALTSLYRKDQDLFLTQNFSNRPSSLDFVFNGVKKLDLTKICSN